MEGVQLLSTIRILKAVPVSNQKPALKQETLLEIPTTTKIVILARTI